MIKNATTLVFLSLFVLSTSCEEKKTSSPECYYETVETYAEIVDMKPHPEGNGRIAIVMDFKASVLALEPQELGDLKDIFIDDAYMQKHNLRKGYKYEVVVSELVKGECDTKLTVAFSHRFK